MSAGCDNNPRYDDDGSPTHTSREQALTEKKCQSLFLQVETPSKLELALSTHVAMLQKGVAGLSAAYQGLDASRPWLCYWVLNSLDVLRQLAPTLAVHGHLEASFVQYLGTTLWHPHGGFQGGPAQLPHLAPCYAATNALVALGSEAAYASVDRQRLYDFLTSMKTPIGAFRMHDNGEVDIRATYCAVAVASVFNLLSPELAAGVPEYLQRCQTFEGGMGGEPGNEAHGGYTFCGLAAAAILGRTDVLSLPRLLHWAAHRQMSYEGGFQGRTNKLVDSCYSFWCGALFPLLASLLPSHPCAPLFLSSALERYLLVCAQDSLLGGFRDKPGARVDFYHTCYSLNGLSIAVHAPGSRDSHGLAQIDPAYGVTLDKLQKAKAHFATLPLISTTTPGLDPAVYAKVHVSAHD